MVLIGYPEKSVTTYAALRPRDAKNSFTPRRKTDIALDPYTRCEYTEVRTEIYFI